LIDIKELKKIASNINVLYVEDNLEIQNLMTQYLKKIFFTVIYAENGLEGLQKYKKEKFDIIITDLSMPVMNGVEMLKEIKEISTKQSIIITSAHARTNSSFDLTNINIDGYITKPFNWEQLNNELYKVINNMNK